MFPWTKRPRRGHRMNPASLKNLNRPWDSETAREAARRRWDAERERRQRAEDDALRLELAEEAYGHVFFVIARLFGAYLRADDRGRHALLGEIERFVARYGCDPSSGEIEPKRGAENG